MARSWSRLFRHLDYFFTVTILNSSICKGRMWWLKIHCPSIYRKSWQLWSWKHSSICGDLPVEKSVGLVLPFGSHTIPHSHPFSFRLTCMFCKLSPNILLFNNLFYFCVHVTNCLFVPCSSLLKIRKEFLDLLPTVFDFLRLKLVLIVVLGMSHRVFPNIVCVFCWVSLFWVGLRSILSYPIWDVPPHYSLIPPSLPYSHHLNVQKQTLFSAGMQQYCEADSCWMLLFRRCGYSVKSTSQGVDELIIDIFAPQWLKRPLSSGVQTVQNYSYPYSSCTCSLSMNSLSFHGTVRINHGRTWWFNPRAKTPP